MEIKKNISILPYNTFRVDVKSKYFVEIDSVNTLQELLKTDIFHENKSFILGGGSNVLFLNNFDGVILKNMIIGKEIINEDENFVYIKVGGGENRHKFVQRTIENNYIGIENLVFIPGSVGASPVQNIGAYGVEAQDVIEEVIGYHINSNYHNEISCHTEPVEVRHNTSTNPIGQPNNSKGQRILNKKECKFGYRTSIFKTNLKDSFFVTEVVFKLKKWKENTKGQFNLSYGGIHKKIEELGIQEEDLTPKKIAEIITEIRKQKLPDREEIGTAGSFFKNPIISTEKYNELKKDFPDLLGFEVQIESQNMIKLSAGQLLQVCGRKGKSEGAIGTYHNHALILINKGGGTGQNIANFAATLQKCVRDTYEVVLEPEVRYVGKTK